MALSYDKRDIERRGFLLPLPPGDFNEQAESLAPLLFNKTTLESIGWAQIPPKTHPVDICGVLNLIVIDVLSDAMNQYLTDYVDVFMTEPSPTVFEKSIRQLNPDVRPPVREEDLSPTALAFTEWYKGLCRSGYASRDARDQLMSNWTRSGGLGASWITKRLLNEKEIDAQEAALEALVRIGQSAVPYLIGALMGLAETQDSEHAALFLRALRWFRPSDLGQWIEKIAALVQRFISSSEREVKEAAYRCTDILPKSEATAILTSARSSEADPEMRTTIQELLEEAERR